MNKDYYKEERDEVHSSCILKYVEKSSYEFMDIYMITFMIISI